MNIHLHLHLRLIKIYKNQKKIKMKKSIFILAALGAFTFSYCKKDYTCTCKNDVTGDVVSTSTVNATKSKASDSCSKGNVAGTSTCTIN